MLEQNTDRMWYVIGALVVGAGIILLTNKFMPEIFANVSNSYQSKTLDIAYEIQSHDSDKTSDGVNLLKESMITAFQSKVDKTKYATTGDLILTTTNNLYSGIQLAKADLPLEPNTAYTLHYSYQKVSGVLTTFGGHTQGHIFSPNLVYFDGEKQPVEYYNNQSIYSGDDTDIHTVEVHFATGSTLEGGDERGIWIQPNRGVTDIATVKIFDLKLEKGETATPF